VVDNANSPNSVAIGRFEDVIDRFGPDPDAWPADERAALLGFAESSAPAQKILADARKLDRLLAQPPGRQASPELMARVLAASLRISRRWASSARTRTGWCWRCSPAGG